MAVSEGLFTKIVGVQWAHPFLACDRGGLLSLSSDLSTWRATNFSGGGTARGAYGKGRFMVFRFDAPHGVLISSGGTNWTAVTDPFPNKAKAIAFGNDLFAILDLSGTGAAQVAFSEDGVSWRYSTPPTFTVSSRQGIGFASGRFFVFGGESFSASYEEVIGYDFSLNQPITTPATANWNKARISSTVDGLSWSAAVDPFAGVDDGTSGTISFTDPSNPSNTVTVSKTIPDISRVSTFADHLAEVPESESRKSETVIPVVVGDVANFSLSAGVARSANGLSGWQTGNVTEGMGSMAYGNGIWVGIGSTGLSLFRSTNGLSWTRYDRNPDFPNVNPIAFGKDQFVACHAGSAWVSSNGITFVERPTGISTDIREIVY